MNSFRVMLAAGMLAAVISSTAPAHSSQDIHKPTQAASNLTGLHDFDFQVGEWRVHHRVKRPGDDHQWLEFDGTCSNRSLMGGWANVEDHMFDKPTGVSRGVALRAYDPKTGEWAIWWIDSRDPFGALDPPVKGRFANGVGTFYSDGILNGKPIRTRFIWSHITPISARWEQAYSSDAGKTWETNWIMEFRRASLSSATCCPIVHAAKEKPTMQTVTPKPTKSGHAAVNGVNYYYAVYGAGEPLLLLHGGMFHTEMFGSNLTKLAQSRQVIGVDLQGHGRTPLGDREISLVDIGNDMAGVLKKLGYDKVDVLGYSMGGGVAFQLAAQHPEMVRRLVLVSTPYAQDGFFPEILPLQAAMSAAIAEQMKETPIYKSYVAIAPHPEEFPKLLDAMGAYMRKSYDWSSDVKKLTMPVMLIYGDSDMFRPEHEVKFYQLLGGGLKDAGWQREHMSQNRLAILPNITHYEMGVAPQLVDTALPFLNAKAAPRVGTSR